MVILFCREFFILLWLFFVAVTFALSRFFVLPWLFGFAVTLMDHRKIKCHPNFILLRVLQCIGNNFVTQYYLSKILPEVYVTIAIVVP